MKVQQQPSYVLHTRPFRETSLLVELFSRDHGRVSLVAKGVRGNKKKIPPRQFVHCLVSWVGRGPLFTLTEYELAPGGGLEGDALACGFYINELLLRMTEPLDVHNYLFETYAKTLRELVESEKNVALSIALRRFEHALLQECGYAPDFTLNAQTGEPIAPDQHYTLHPELGFVSAPADEAIARGAELTEIYVGNFHTPSIRRAAKRIFQAALRPHLGDRPLTSRELLLTANRRGV